MNRGGKNVMIKGKHLRFELTNHPHITKLTETKTNRVEKNGRQQPKTTNVNKMVTQ